MHHNGPGAVRVGRRRLPDEAEDRQRAVRDAVIWPAGVVVLVDDPLRGAAATPLVSLWKGGGELVIMARYRLYSREVCANKLICNLEFLAMTLCGMK